MRFQRGFLAFILLTAFLSGIAFARPKELVPLLIYASKPLIIEDLQEGFGGNLRVDKGKCNDTKEKSLNEPGLRCEEYVVNNVSFGSVVFNLVSYIPDTDGNVRVMIALYEGDCEKALKTFFDLARNSDFPPVSHPFNATGTDSEITYLLPAGGVLKSDTLTLRRSEMGCQVIRRETREDD